MKDKLENAKQILQGFTNLLKSKINLSSEEIEVRATYRLNICDNCTSKNSITNSCKECGCYLPSLTRSDHGCALNHW